MSSPPAPISAAPPQIRMRRRGEDRLVEHVLPVAGKLLLRDDARGERMAAPAGAGHHHAASRLRRARAPKRQRRQIERAERTHEPEARGLVVGDRVTRHDAVVGETDPDLVRLGDEIADGQHHVVADDDAVPATLRAEHLRCEGVVRHFRAQPYDRGQRALEVEVVFAGLRLPGGRDLPVTQARHLGSVRSSFVAPPISILPETGVARQRLRHQGIKWAGRRRAGPFRLPLGRRSLPGGR